MLTLKFESYCANDKCNCPENVYYLNFDLNGKQIESFINKMNVKTSYLTERQNIIDHFKYCCNDFICKVVTYNRNYTSDVYIENIIFDVINN